MSLYEYIRIYTELYPNLSTEEITKLAMADMKRSEKADDEYCRENDC
jgi:hypothetical protein